MSFQRCMIDRVLFSGKYFRLLKVNLNSLFCKPTDTPTNHGNFPRCIRCSTFSSGSQQSREVTAGRRDFSTASETHSFEERTWNDPRNGSSTVNHYTTRSHTCGELRTTDIGKKVTLCGWAEFIRLNKFVLLRDAYGTTQVILRENDEISSVMNSLHLESTICVTGIVRARPESQIKKSMSTGEIEVEAESISVLCNAVPKLPFHIRDYNKAIEKTSNQHRYLALRFPELQHNLRLRSEMLFKMREFLIRGRNFVEVETPTLFKKTPGGAQEFIVPTSFKDKFYSLVQSPQQLKQLLMVGSVDRYFQIARCYRDEKSSSERQPEFTQLDVELSFTNVEGVIQLTEEVLAASWPASKPHLQIPFPRIKYKDALENFGSDKPCLIDKFCFQNLEKYVADGDSKHVHMFIIPNGKTHHSKLSPRFNELSASSNVTIYSIKVSTQEKFHQSLSNIIPSFDVSKFRNNVEVKNDDLVVMAVGPNKMKTLRMLGLCRHHTLDHLKFIQELNKNGVYQFFWVVDFPLVELGDSEEIVSVHHPFTQPHPEDASLLDADILKIRSLAYDLVLNGSEIGGGSIRIHDAELQKKMFQLLGLDESFFSHLLKALQMGCPPHGGIALGLDRLVAILCNCESIRDVIAFPKSADGFDFMTECPNDVPIEDKIRYHICTNIGNTENSEIVK